MAYYSPIFSSADFVEEFDQAPFADYYLFAPKQSSVAYTGYDRHHIAVNQSAISYSAYSHEPKFIEYTLAPYEGGYHQVVTDFVLSYSSTSAINDLDFEEYDPTSYGGGYDQALTYGKPLPPSDATCYPRSGPVPIDAALPTNSMDLPVQTTESSKESGQTEVEEEEKQSSGSSGDQLGNGIKNEGPPNAGEDKVRISFDDQYPWSGYEFGFGDSRGEGIGYECNRQVPHQVPYGYNSDAMDFCESIFGSWPCLYKERQRGYGHQRDSQREASGNNLSRGIADYLFGGSW